MPTDMVLCAINKCSTNKFVDLESRLFSSKNTQEATGGSHCRNNLGLSAANDAQKLAKLVVIIPRRKSNNIQNSQRSQRRT